MLRIAICDDSAGYVKHMEQLIGSWQNGGCHSVCFGFSNGYELACAHSESPFDIILLDIVMPVVNGIETAREIRRNDRNVKIVFLTSSAEFAVESYTVKADNYLLKSVSVQALYQCLDELSEQITRSVPSITVKGFYAVHRIPLDSIEYAEAQNKQIVFTLQDGTEIKTGEPLHILENKLLAEYGFFRCHRSYIVNINHISTYTNKEITMSSGCRIPISRSCQKNFESAYFQFIFGSAGE